MQASAVIAIMSVFDRSNRRLAGISEKEGEWGGRENVCLGLLRCKIETE